MSTRQHATDIMVRRLVTLPTNLPVVDGIRRLLKNQITGAPVVDERGHFIAVFAERSCLSALLTAVSHPRASTTVVARDMMARKLVTLTPQMDVIDAIGLLLKNRISGAPVLDRSGNFLGVFSEKSSMRVLIDAAYEQTPTAEVGAYMNPDIRREIEETTPLRTIIEMFLETPFRRLEVVRGNRVLGQISRRDAIRAAFPLLERMRGGEPAGAVVAPHLAGASIREFMDSAARTIAPEADLLEIARIFLDTNYRRLPVVNDEDLHGQISRRDLLAATHAMLAPSSDQDRNLLYLSSIHERHEAPIT